MNKEQRILLNVATALQVSSAAKESQKCVEVLSNLGNIYIEKYRYCASLTLQTHDNVSLRDIVAALQQICDELELQ